MTCTIKTCRNGHPLIASNIYCNGSGRPECVICHKERKKKRNALLNAMPPCLECGKRQPASTRGICYRCCCIPEIKARYPLAAEKPGEPGEELPEPTETLPGSTERLAVLEERAAAGQCLWHPDDRRDFPSVPVPSEQCRDTVYPGVVKEPKVRRVVMGTGIRGEG
jgi:hypothetical protein